MWTVLILLVLAVIGARLGVAMRAAGVFSDDDENEEDAPVSRSERNTDMFVGVLGAILIYVCVGIVFQELAK